MISKDILQKLTNAFVMYEIATHGVDPREKLDGTTMRISKNEGYKFRIIDAWNNQTERIRQGRVSYVDAVLEALPGVNLVSYRQKKNIEERLKAQGSETFETALNDLFEGDNDQQAFGEIVDSIGGYYDVIGFLFFLKNPNEYMPIRSELFEERLRLLGVDAHLSHNCSWENYLQYNDWIDEIYKYLHQNMNDAVQKIDAHSFLWVVPGLSAYIDNDVQIVEHTKYGKGIVVGFERDLIRIRFGKEIKSFDKQDCFTRGLLKFVPIEISLYGDEEETDDGSVKNGENEKKGKSKQKKLIQPIDEETKIENDRMDAELLSKLDKDDKSEEGTFSYIGGVQPRPEPEERSGKPVFPRNPAVARRALILAGHRCEINADDPTFIRKSNGKPYTEPHHLVPMAFQNQFDASLDREENIVSLCSNCHNEIHYGRNANKLIEILYSERKELLESIGVEITLDELKQMY